LQAIPQWWTVNTENAIVYPVEAGGGVTDLLATIGIDNGIHIWVNGEFRFGARQPIGYWFYDIPLGDLEPGLNYIQVLREDSGGGTYYSLVITGSPAPLPGTTCELGDVGVVDGVKVAEVVVRNQRNGLAEITASATNADVEIPPFASGTTAPVVVVVTKTSDVMAAVARLVIEDPGAEQVPCDWTDAIKQGRKTLSLEGVVQSQHLITVHNGEPGFKKLYLTVGDATVSVDRLRDDRRTEVDISQLLTEEDNAVEIHGLGPPGASATLLFPWTESESEQ
jgi:hypothetical protein